MVGLGARLRPSGQQAQPGEIAAVRTSRMAVTWAAASEWRLVRTAAWTRPMSTHRASGHAGGQHARRADLRRMLVGVLEITSPQCGERA